MFSLYALLSIICIPYMAFEDLSKAPSVFLVFSKHTHGNQIN